MATDTDVVFLCARDIITIIMTISESIARLNWPAEQKEFKQIRHSKFRGCSSDSQQSKVRASNDVAQSQRGRKAASHGQDRMNPPQREAQRHTTPKPRRAPCPKGGGTTEDSPAIATRTAVPRATRTLRQVPKRPELAMNRTHSVFWRRGGWHDVIS